MKRKSPFKDYAGRPIYEGDTIIHPSLEEGIVVYLEGQSSKFDAWRVEYTNDPIRSRLCLQIGERGMAVVQS